MAGGSGRPLTAGVRAERGRLLVSIAQLTPALAYFALFYVGPLLVLVYISFLTFRNFQFVEPLSFNNYANVVTSETFRVLFSRTVLLSLLSAVLAIAIAYPFTYIITFVFPGRSRSLYFLILVALFGGYLVRIYAWRTILGVEGVINGTLMTLGVIEEPIREILNGPFAVVVSMVNFLVPLAVLPIYAAMQNVSPGVIEAARDLGSSRLQVTRRVILPLVLPGVLVAFAFCFIAAAGDFAIPALLGGVESPFIGNQIQFQIGQTSNWPLAAAMATTLIALVVLIVAGVALVARRVIR
ncbi:MAG: ABC transporter permease [Chloroflexi bacterium]|nr:ABC transporter permease [Chloroflexota bacterium]